MPLEKESDLRGEASETFQLAEDAELARVTRSDIFRTAPVMRTLLLYLWQHRSEPISEYAIAVDALGRRPDFDPKIDATVRVQIARLRVKLKEFYEAEGETLGLRLTIPLGGHQLEWIYTPKPDLLASPDTDTRPRASRMLLPLACATVALALLSLFLVLQNRNLKASAKTSPTPLPRF